MSTDRQIYLLDELQSLLEEQVEQARGGRLSKVETLSERAGAIVEEIARAGILEAAEFKGRRERLAELYRDLRLTLAGQKDEVGRQLEKVRKGRKTIGAYRSNI